jgi:antitoxin component YwqK of YwqJK toxin-antitoxin module
MIDKTKTMKNKISLILFTLIISSTLFGQKLSLTDLTNLCNKKNWQDVNQFMLVKGWTYYNSEKGDTDNYSTITWSYNKEDYSDKAQGWFYLYTYDDYPNKISYSIFNKASYLLLQNSLTANGFKVVDSEIEDEQVISTYANSGYTLKVTNAKRSDDDYSDRSMTSYNITLIKKSGIYDNDNGKKTDYYDDYAIKLEHTLLNGKLNGPFKFYDEKGNLKRSGNYSNDLLSGKIVEYDEDGGKSAEFNMSNGKKNGLATSFENNKISYTTNYKDDLSNGLYTGFYYNETTNKLDFKEIGPYVNDEKNGLWKTNYVEGATERTVFYTNYLKNIKEGQFQDVTGDSLIVGHYKNDELNGSYKVYLDVNKNLFGGIINTNIPELKLIEEGQYNNGKKTGYWRNYTMSGSLSADGNYIEDLENGEWNYYLLNYVKKNGEPEAYSKKLFLKNNYAKGKLNGKTQRFYYSEETEYPCDEVDDNGIKVDSCTKSTIHEIFETSNYKDGELTGIYELRDSINQLVSKGQYEDDLKEGKWLTHKAGNIIQMESNYKLGLLDGELIEYNDAYKPLKIKQFESGKLQQLVVNDSLGIKRNYKYDILERTDASLKVKQSEYFDDGIVSKVYWLKNDTENDDYFELDFLLKTSTKSDGRLGYTDGEFLFTTLNNEPLITGKLYKEYRSDTWTYYYYPQKVKIEKKFIDNTVVDELYLNLDSTVYSGEFEYVDTDKNIKEIRKIKDGLRNGKTEYIDKKTNKTINKENYKEGKLKA